ncbi:hypothetical protein [Nonomuraea terrae]|uniref:MmyB family transcriptional regulator n=1 Tax=Nonomuraea terrae TaxID=2530383 RepID=UPI0014042E44|nr:hypothetical protein [Nonomuraea terrae]
MAGAPTKSWTPWPAAAVERSRTHPPGASGPGRQFDATPDHTRFIFLDPRSRRFWGDWDRADDDTVALLHAQAGRNPYDKDLADQVGELPTRSEDFRTRPARHDVRQHHLGAKPFHHPVVGDLHLTYESMDPPADGLTLVAYGTTPPASGWPSASRARPWRRTFPLPGE